MNMESKAKWSRPEDEIIAFYVAQETAVEKRTGVSRQILSTFFVCVFIILPFSFSSDRKTSKIFC